ncbi:cell division protein FtsQ/DivIB [Micromonospora sp. NPDC003197]
MTPGWGRGRTTGPPDASAGATPGGPGSGPGARAGGTRRWRLVRASNDAVPPSVRRFMRRARQRRLRAAMPWLVTGGVLAVAAVLTWVVLGTGVFGVRELRVVGAQLVTPEQVRAAAEVPHGVPLAQVDLAAVQWRVGRLAPVGRVTVSRDWPDALLIEVVERTPVAVVPQGQQFAVIDSAGVVFQTVTSRPEHLPLARVPEPGPADLATRNALQVLAALTPELRERLTEVVVEGPARIKVLLRGGRTVIWGDASNGDTKARVVSALLSREGDVIDVSAPDVVTIR